MQRRLSLSHSAYKVSENRETVEASNLKIKVIDEFSSGMAAKIKYLNISHNLISKLENMRQFIFLQEIDVSHNSIKNGK
jgi:Leucine-rich repeat (LRR) protein